MKKCIIICLAFTVLLCACGTQRSNIKIAETVDETKETVDYPPWLQSVNFDNYQDFFLYFETAGKQGGENGELSEYDSRLQAYVESVAKGEKSLIIPYVGDSPVEIRQCAGIEIDYRCQGLYLFGSTSFTSFCEDTRIRIDVAEIPDEHKELSHTATFTQFLAEVYPYAHKVTNLKEMAKYGVVNIYEETITVNGKEVCAMIRETDYDRTTTEFLIDEKIVSISADSGELTDEWLNQLHFEEVTFGG